MHSIIVSGRDICIKNKKKMYIIVYLRVYLPITVTII